MELMLALASGFMISWSLIQRGIAAWDAWHESVMQHHNYAWVRAQCLNESFSSNIRVHSDICERAQRHASRTPFLHALSAAMQEHDTPWLPAAIFLMVALSWTTWMFKAKKRANFTPFSMI
jgi:hypothetical protein